MKLFPVLFSIFLQMSMLAQNPPAPQAPQPQSGQTIQAGIPSSPGLSQPTYQLGPGDTVRVIVWTGNEYLQDNLTVASDGTLFIPFFVNKIVNVTGLTATQLRELILTELQAVFRKPVVQVITVGFESKKALLVGEVSTPGYFPIFGNTRILDFMVQHGGFSQRANLTEVQVTHANGQKLKVNVYDIVLNNDQSQNILVAPGDIIFVPSVETISKKYFMLGEVRNPGLLQSQTDLTLLEAIARSGTLAASAREQHVFVVRQNPDGKVDVRQMLFSDIYQKGDFSQNILLKSGDVVYIPKNLHTRVAEVLGAVTPILSFLRDSVFLYDIFRR
ncbi:MAG TPA: SLBB domain-containing protein [Acidobacteriota bacterium]|jgi:polysaccharide export outer membrane protein